MKTRIYETVRVFDNPISLEDFERQFRGKDSDKRIKFGEIQTADGKVHEIENWFRYTVDCEDRCDWQVRRLADGRYEVDDANGTFIYPASAVKLWIKDFENCCGDKFDIYLIKKNVMDFAEYDTENPNCIRHSAERLFEVEKKE